MNINLSMELIEDFLKQLTIEQKSCYEVNVEAIIFDGKGTLVIIYTAHIVC